jgi:hypothetical protein
MSSDATEPITIWFRRLPPDAETDPSALEWCFWRPADDDWWGLVDRGTPTQVAQALSEFFILEDEGCLFAGYSHLAERMNQYRDTLDAIGMPHDIDFPNLYGNGDGCWGFYWDRPNEDVSNWHQINQDRWAEAFTRVFGPAALFRGKSPPPFDLTDPTAVLVCADWLEERGDVRRATLCRRFGTHLSENGLPVMTREAGRLVWGEDGRPVVTRINVEPWKELPPLPPPDPDGFIRIPL